MSKKPKPTTDPKELERRRKIGEASRKTWAKPGVVERASKALVAKWKDPEYQAKISAARKEQHAKAKDPKPETKPLPPSCVFEPTACCLHDTMPAVYTPTKGFTP